MKALIVLSLLASSAYAGNEGPGGGDLCEDRIQVIRDDIKSWIKNGGPELGLQLPNGISTEKYSSAMLSAMENTKIKCVKPGDKGYPIAIGDTPKTCKFEKAKPMSFITCDYNSFLDKQRMDESSQYVLIHHEYAGIAELENPEGDMSTYKISNQISEYLESQVIKRLAVKPRPTSKSTQPRIVRDKNVYRVSFAYIQEKYGIDPSLRLFNQLENLYQKGAPSTWANIPSVDDAVNLRMALRLSDAAVSSKGWNGTGEIPKNLEELYKLDDFPTWNVKGVIPADGPGLARTGLLNGINITDQMIHEWCKKLGYPAEGHCELQPFTQETKNELTKGTAAWVKKLYAGFQENVRDNDPVVMTVKVRGPLDTGFFTVRISYRTIDSSVFVIKYEITSDKSGGPSEEYPTTYRLGAREQWNP